MKIVFFTHPDFLTHQSMPRFARMLENGMKQRGHSVETWSAKPVFFNWPISQKFKKWMGYIDQYLVFPHQFKKRVKVTSKDTLFVFTDHALGPWVPYVADRLNVIHCHDFLAQRSAMDEIEENPTGWTGKKYQAYIRNGYRQGKNFISVSQKTKSDLHAFLESEPLISRVVYNGLNQDFITADKQQQREFLSDTFGLNLLGGFILHVGGNQWYKNRTGIIEIYNAWRVQSKLILPLLLIGEVPSDELLTLTENSTYKNDIHFLSNVKDEQVKIAYSAATTFIFPSLAEGFGWPIAEAMASGTPVITTDEAPMTEVAGHAAFLIPRKPYDKKGIEDWAINVADVLDKAVNLSGAELDKIIQVGIDNAKRFNSDKAVDEIESIYLKIVQTQNQKM